MWSTGLISFQGSSNRMYISNHKVMRYIISVAKTYSHRGNHRHRLDTKKQWFVYYYDEEGSFHSKKISYLQAMYYKSQKMHRIKYVCLECGQMFMGLVKSKNEVPQCPNGCE